MALEAEYDALTDGLLDAELRASLCKDLGVYDGSESDIESFLSPNCWLDNTTAATIQPSMTRSTPPRPP